jgi:hypothetical protein
VRLWLSLMAGEFHPSKVITSWFCSSPSQSSSSSSSSEPVYPRNRSIGVRSFSLVFPLKPDSFFDFFFRLGKALECSVIPPGASSPWISLKSPALRSDDEVPGADMVEPVNGSSDSSNLAPELDGEDKGVRGGEGDRGKGEVGDAGGPGVSIGAVSKEYGLRSESGLKTGLKESEDGVTVVLFAAVSSMATGETVSNGFCADRFVFGLESVKPKSKKSKPNPEPISGKVRGVSGMTGGTLSCSLLSVSLSFPVSVSKRESA